MGGNKDLGEVLQITVALVFGYHSRIQHGVVLKNERTDMDMLDVIDDSSYELLVFSNHWMNRWVEMDASFILALRTVSTRSRFTHGPIALIC